MKPLLLVCAVALVPRIAGGAAGRFVYSNANLAAIVADPDVPFTNAGATVGSLQTTFPAQSITVLVVPGR